MAMATLVRNATSNFSRRVDGYELLNTDRRRTELENLGVGGNTPTTTTTTTRTFSRRRAQSVVASLSYKRERAKRRQIFLKSYKLSTVDDNWGRPMTRKKKLKKMVVKVKTVVVSVVSFLRFGSFKSCNCPSAICAASPISIKKFC